MTVDDPTIAVEPEAGVDKSARAKLVGAAFLAAAFALFAIQNTASTQVQYLAWTFDIPRIVLIVISAAVAITIWELASLLRRRRKRTT